MKKNIVMAGLGLVALYCNADVLTEYTFDGGSDEASNVSPYVSVSAWTNHGAITIDSTWETTSASGDVLPESSDPSKAAATNFYSFVVTVENLPAGNYLSLTNIAGLYGMNNGWKNFYLHLYSDAVGYTGTGDKIGSSSFIGNEFKDATTNQAFNIDLTSANGVAGSAFTALSNGDSIEFRFYHTDSSVSDARFHTLDDISLQGELVTEAAPITLAQYQFPGGSLEASSTNVYINASDWLAVGSTGVVDGTTSIGISGSGENAYVRASITNTNLDPTATNYHTFAVTVQNLEEGESLNLIRLGWKHFSQNLDSTNVFEAGLFSDQIGYTDINNLVGSSSISNNAGDSFTIDLTSSNTVAGSTFTGLSNGQTVEFRIYLADNSDDGNKIHRLDNISLQGRVVPASGPIITGTPVAGGFKIEWEPVAGYSSVVVYSTDLVGTPFTNLSATLPYPVNSYTDTVNRAESFYKVELQP